MPDSDAGTGGTRRPPFYITTLVPRLLKPVSQTNAWIYRRTGGRVAGGVQGKKLCLLTTTGRRSGQLRTSALLYVEDGERIILVAAQGGLPRNPMWFLNLQADPEVTIQTGSVVRTMRARAADDAERAELWPRLIRHYKGWAQYQSWTERIIPVVICEPA